VLFLFAELSKSRPADIVLDSAVNCGIAFSSGSRSCSGSGSDVGSGVSSGVSSGSSSGSKMSNSINWANGKRFIRG
jgi:hypothetical protein